MTYRIYPPGLPPDPSGYIFLPAGDLDGDGSSNADPRVGQLTGIGGVVSLRAGVSLALSGVVATTGDIRAAHGTVILSARNLAGTGNSNILTTTAGSLIFGANTGTQFTSFYYTAASLHEFQTSGGAVRLQISGASVKLGTGVNLSLAGATVAASGDIRAQHGTTIIASRNSTNTADIHLVSTEGGYCVIGSTTLNVGTYYRATTFHQFSIAGATYATMGGSAGTTLTLSVPLALPGTTSSTGDIRAANGTEIIVARNDTNTADLCVAQTSTTNLFVGGTISVTKQFAGTYIAASAGVFARIGGVDRLSVTSLSVTMGASVQLVLTTASSGIKFGTGAGAPTITSGTGAPAAAEQNGSLYMRTDGAAGTTLYVRAAGAWSALT